MFMEYAVYGVIFMLHFLTDTVSKNTFVGVVAVGLFADNPIPLETTSGRAGLFKGKFCH